MRTWLDVAQMWTALIVTLVGTFYCGYIYHEQYVSDLELDHEYRVVYVDATISDSNGASEGFMVFSFFGSGKKSLSVYVPVDNTNNLADDIFEARKWLNETLEEK